jgi:hypothetical protein
VPPGAALSLDDAASNEEVIMLSSRTLRDGMRWTYVSVLDIHCGGCLQKTAAAHGKLGGVANARANLSSRPLLMATVGMSLSSVIVLANTLRLGYGPRANPRLADRTGLATPIDARPAS